MKMGHKCFISFKKEDERYKKEIQRWCDASKVDMIDKSLNNAIDSESPDYVMRKIREDYLSDSTVTIFLIGVLSAEVFGIEEQQYIKRELQASLYNGDGNTRNAILGVVLPEMYSAIYKGTYQCSTCHKNHNWVAINDDTVIKEFSRNYYLNNHGNCGYSEDDRYCVLVKWDDFKINPNQYIDEAYKKRGQEIANDVVVYPK